MNRPDEPQLVMSCAQSSVNNTMEFLMKLPTDQVMKLVPCKVCGDRSSGVHYGVITCEGCKGFYRRTTEDRVSSECKKNHEHLPINKENRNRCRECRLGACQKAGMDITKRYFGRMSRQIKMRVIEEAISANPGNLACMMKEVDKVPSSVGRAGNFLPNELSKLHHPQHQQHRVLQHHVQHLQEQKDQQQHFFQTQQEQQQLQPQQQQHQQQQQQQPHHHQQQHHHQHQHHQLQHHQQQHHQQQHHQQQHQQQQHHQQQHQQLQHHQHQHQQQQQHQQHLQHQQQHFEEMQSRPLFEGDGQELSYSHISELPSPDEFDFEDSLENFYLCNPPVDVKKEEMSNLDHVMPLQ